MKKNRAKIIIILLFIAGAIYGLYPTYQSRDYQSELDKFGSSPKDSLARVKWMTANGEAMKSANAKAIKLGLDLRGGIYVTIEVDVLKFLEEQAIQKDDIFNQVLAATANDEANSTDPTVTLFVKNFQKLASPKGKALANYFYFAGASDDASIQSQLQKGAEEAVDQAKEIIRNRIDQFGLTEPTIQREGARRIIVELPGVGDPTQVHQLLEGTAQLEFRLEKPAEIVQKIIRRIDKTLSTDSATLASLARDTAFFHKAGDTASSSVTATPAPEATKGTAAKTPNKGADSTKLAAKANSAKDSALAAAAAKSKLTPEDSERIADSIGNIGLTDAQKLEKFQKEHPFSYILGKSSNPKTGYYMSEDDRKTFRQMLSRKDVQAIYADEMSFMFGKPIQSKTGDNYYPIFFLNERPELTGKVITGARADISPDNGQPEVTMQMDDDGAKEWKRITGANIHKRVAIVLDSVVYSAPTVNQQIPNGNSQITGSGDMAEANLLAIILKVGALPAPVKIIQEQVVGPSLGADSISKGTWSILWSFIVVIIFMGMYYITGGMVADIAVLINLLFTLAVLATFGATLTLPGMAGLVLTVGIAVDANVLIYERIREELSAGKSLKLAIDDGYRRAFAPIFDGHLTAFFSGVILYSFGTGTVQGFAVTLMIGIAASLFTAIIITRVIIDILLEYKPEIIHFG